MSLIDQHAHGEFCWAELATSDVAAAKQFYGKIMGWAIEDLPMGDGHVYTMCMLDGREAAAMYSLMPEQKEKGVPPHWMLYINVTDIDAATTRAAELGATVLAGPLDVSDNGRMAVLRDPAGAHISLWQAASHVGIRIQGQHGTLYWPELISGDVQKATAFYTALFGWNSTTMRMGGDTFDYTVFMNGEKPIAGMMPILPIMEGVPPHWLPYFQVDDPDLAASLATEFGGKVYMGPSDEEGIGRFANIGDAQDAAFAVIRPAAQATGA